MDNPTTRQRLQGFTHYAFVGYVDDVEDGHGGYLRTFTPAYQVRFGWSLNGKKYGETSVLSYHTHADALAFAKRYLDGL